MSDEWVAVLAAVMYLLFVYQTRPESKDAHDRYEEERR